MILMIGLFWLIFII